MRPPSADWVAAGAAAASFVLALIVALIGAWYARKGIRREEDAETRARKAETRAEVADGRLADEYAIQKAERAAERERREHAAQVEQGAWELHRTAHEMAGDEYPFRDPRQRQILVYVQIRSHFEREQALWLRAHGFDVEVGDQILYRIDVDAARLAAEDDPDSYPVAVERRARVLRERARAFVRKNSAWVKWQVEPSTPLMKRATELLASKGHGQDNSPAGFLVDPLPEVPEAEDDETKSGGG